MFDIERNGVCVQIKRVGFLCFVRRASQPTEDVTLGFGTEQLHEKQDC